MCVKTGTFLYNTNVAFGPSGNHLATYHKAHLARTYPWLDQPLIPEVVTFTAPFGVTFGTFVCFDLAFAEPKASLLARGVTDFAYPTFWGDDWNTIYEPFTPTLIHAAFSRGAHVNLIAANGQTWGSGIFAVGEPVNQHYILGGGGPASVMMVADVGSGGDLGYGSYVATVALESVAPPRASPAPKRSAAVAGPRPPMVQGMYVPCNASDCASFLLGAGEPVNVTVSADSAISGARVSCSVEAAGGAVGTAASQAQLYGIIAFLAPSLSDGQDWSHTVPSHCGNYSTRHSGSYIGCYPDIPSQALCKLVQCGLDAQGEVWCAKTAHPVANGSVGASIRMIISVGGNFDAVYFEPFVALGPAQAAPRNLTDFQVDAYGRYGSARLVTRRAPIGDLYGLALAAHNRSWVRAADLPGAAPLHGLSDSPPPSILV